ncbi:MAG: sporulation integral membrane protein YtvI [Herbinix sp.]|nr:sporulation integral membrane protein YtvI [Herbinix sp.]
MKESRSIYVKILINFLFIITVALFMFLVLPKLLSFFMPLVVGWVISLIANPLVHFLEKRVKLLRKHSSFIIIVTVILAIVGIMTLLSILIFKEAKELMTDFPAIVEDTGEKLSDITEYISKRSEALPESMRNTIDNFIVGVQDYINNFSDNANVISMDRVGLFAKNVAEAFLYVIITILSAYFFTACKDELTIELKKHLPEAAVNYWRLIFDNFKAAFGGYFKAQFKIMLILIVIMFIGFEILQVKFSFLMALGIAFLDFLPVFGTGTILWPWAVLETISGNYIIAVSLVVIYLICQIVKQILQPKMVGDSIGLHPLATLIFLFAGYKLYGVFGMIIGIPIGMVLVNLYRIGMFDRIIRGFKILAHDINEFRKF